VNSIERKRARIAAREAQQAAEHQRLLAEVARKLRERKILSSVEAEEAQRKLAERSLRAQNAEEEIRRVGADRYYDEDVVLARIAELQSRQVELEALTQTARRRLEANAAEIERCTVRASTRGKIGSAAAIRVGDVLGQGDSIATVIPAEDVHIAGEFLPSDAVGRIVPGQAAVVRLSGFSWMDHGTLRATVSRVASEPGPDGRVHVELKLSTQRRTSVPLQHGLPGSVEIQVETVTPWTLLARILGASLTQGPAPVLAASSERTERP
jgi:multidrug resistance efflux pump